MKNIKTYIATLLLISLASCEKSNDYYGTPDLSGECTTMTTTKTVANFVATSTSTMQQYTANDVIEAYVTSSDAGGNFYKSISFVSVVNNELKGFSMPIDDYNLYTKFEPGRKVYVNLKDRYFITENGATVLGSRYDNGTPTILTDDEVGRISGVEYKDILKRSCEKVDEDALVRNVTIAQAKSDTYLNQLVELSSVQFSNASIGKTYFDASLNNLGSATNHTVTDLTGNTIILRASQYATFASELIPSGNGKIRGVMTKYGLDYQFMIRTINDVQLTDVRQTVDLSPPKVGASITSPYPTTLSENFESYTTSTGGYLFPKYINDAYVGARYWDVKSFSSNKYAQMSSFGSNETNKTYLIMPITFTPGYKLSFKTKDGYNNGSALKVYYSTDYVLGGNIGNATLTNITSSFAIATGTTTGYATNFTNSGIYTIPTSLSGQGYIIFEYSGSSTGVTTTYQIDDVMVTP